MSYYELEEYDSEKNIYQLQIIYFTYKIVFMVRYLSNYNVLNITVQF